MGGEEGRYQQLVVQPRLRGEQRVDRHRLWRTGAGGRGAQRPDGGRVEPRGLERLPQSKRIGGARLGSASDGEQLRRGTSLRAGQCAEQGCDEGLPPHSSTPKPR